MIIVIVFVVVVVVVVIIIIIIIISELWVRHVVKPKKLGSSIIPDSNKCMSAPTNLG